MKTTILKTKNTIASAFVSLWTAFWMLQLNTGVILAVNSNTESIDTFINFVCDWLKKIGAVVALVGGVMFALSWQRDDAEGKSRALMTLMAGFMLVAISAAKDIFGL